jgi:hypothetical protein
MVCPSHAGIATLIEKKFPIHDTICTDPINLAIRAKRTFTYEQPPTSWTVQPYGNHSLFTMTPGYPKLHVSGKYQPRIIDLLCYNQPQP